MGFLSNLVSATIKTALTPISVVKDVADVIIGEEPENTKKLLESATDDVKKALDDIT